MCLSLSVRISLVYLLLLSIIFGGSELRANSSFQSFPQEEFINTGILCHPTYGSRWITSPQNRKFLGVDSFGVKILRGRIEDGKKMIIEGSAFGYFCDLIPETPERYVVLIDPVSDAQNINIFLKADHTTPFSDYRFKYFKVNFQDPYRFKIEVSVKDFFLPRDANLLEKGLSSKKFSFYVSFQFPNPKSKLIENF
jgi:hypothetical protein